MYKSPLPKINVSSPKNIKERRAWLSFSSFDKLNESIMSYQKEDIKRDIGKSPIFFNKYKDSFMDLKCSSPQNNTKYNTFKFKQFQSSELRKSNLFRLLSKLNKKSRPEWCSNFSQEASVASFSQAESCKTKNRSIFKQAYSKK